MKGTIVLCLLLQCALLPLISGKTTSGGNNMEVTKDGEGNFLSKSNSLRDSIPNSGVKGNDGEDEIVENWKLDPSQATPTKLFTAYKETYITKAAAKKFLQKIRSLKKPYTDKEYDDLLQELMLEPKPTSKYSSIYDKKYFDYLPSDQSEGKMEVAKVDQEITEKPQHIHPHHHYGRHHHHKKERSKRHANTDEGEKKIAKRQTEAEWTRHFLEHERLYNEHLRRAHEEERSRRYSQQYQPVVYANHIYSPPVTGVYNNPWNNPYYRPQLNNQYLPPAAPSQFIVRPEETYINYPIPGVIYNVPHPPQNPPSTQVSKPQPTDQPEEVPSIVTETRFGEEDDVDKPPIWDVQEKPSRFIPQRPNPATQRPSQITTTRRPPSTPSFIRDNEDFYDDLSSSNRIPQIGGGQTPSPTTRRPQLPVIRNEEDYDDVLSGSSGNNQRFPSQTNSNQLGSGSPSVQQPVQRPTSPPPTAATRTPQADGPSRCVWAIVNCCSPRNPAVRYACFERVGCNGVFWDLNPCSDVVVQAAIDETNRYFN